MSYQPSPLPTPPAPVAPPRRSRTGLLVGIVLLVGGLVGAGVLYAAQRSAYEEAIRNLQRAGSGLSTQLVFEREGTFTLYYEYAGEFTAEVDGDEEDIELDARSTPRQIDVRLLDADGDRVKLDRDVDEVTYDTGGYAGVAYRTVEIDDTGSYTLDVESESGRDEFAIAIGIGLLRPPTLLFPAVLAAGGVVLGLLAIGLLGRRRRPPVAAPAGGALGAWPSAAPTAPPSAPEWLPTSPPAATPPPANAVPGGWAPQAPPAAPAAPPAPPAAPPAPPPSAWPPPPA